MEELISESSLLRYNSGDTIKQISRAVGDRCDVTKRISKRISKIAGGANTKGIFALVECGTTKGISIAGEDATKRISKIAGNASTEGVSMLAGGSDEPNGTVIGLEGKAGGGREIDVGNTNKT